MRSWRVRDWKFLLTVVGVCILLPIVALAQTGKIKGSVVDKDTGEPIIGANVLIEGTTRGAATDLDGVFFIIGVGPGKYTIKASSVGYHEMTYEEVEVNIDRTTTLEFKLTPSTMKLEEVVVTYEKPVVELGTTSSVTRITGESLQTSAVEDVSAVLESMPGFKLDEEGKIHIRGGRNSEARFVVDGIDSRDPITGEVLPINLNAVNIQEIQILTGGMSAEYGQAMSGIVNITTPEGQPDRYNGSVEWSQDHLFDDESFNQDKANASFGGPLPLTKKVFGRPITFYLTANMNLTDTYTPLGVEYTANDYAGFGFNVPQRQYNDWSTSMKFALEMGNGRKMSCYYSTRSRVWDLYPVGYGDGTVPGSFTWRYLYDLENRPTAQDRRSAINIEYTHQVSSKTLYKFTVGRQVLNASCTPGNKTPGEFTLADEVEEFEASGVDQNNNGVWDQDADNDGIVHSDTYDELAIDEDGNNYTDGYFDSNYNDIYDGGGEGYEDLNMNGRWDPGEDWIDLNADGVYDYAEPWTDRADPVTGANNIGVWDPWDPYVDLNGNGTWDPAEPQLPEQDTNGNGRWDGERYQDANGNGAFDRWEAFTDLNGDGVWQQGEPFVDLNGNGIQDDGEGYDDSNLNGEMDQQDLVPISNGLPEDDPEPFWDGDLYYDTGEPFIDLPDPVTGLYNGYWDQGEPFWDLPSSNSGAQLASIIGFNTEIQGDQQWTTPTLNGQYDAPNNYFDEYELFTFFSGDKSYPIGYTWNPDNHGSEWVYTDFYQYNPNRSTWTNRTLHDTDNPSFDVPNFQYDEGEEKYIDYNGNGEWNGVDLFLNPGRWDNAAVWSKRRTEEYSFDFSWQSQVHEFHEVKAGLEGKHYIMSNQYISNPDQLYTGEANVSSSEPWPERGSVRDFWEYRPWEGAAYVQDKMEFEGLIVQAGLRTDFVVHDDKVVEEQRRRYEAGEPGAVEADRSQFQFAPRLGISHPITAQSKLYFNYGHFYQRPAFTYFYKATTTNLDQGTVGNPNLKFEKTVTYELGVHTQLTSDLSVQIAGYYRDIYDMISTVAETDGPVTIYKYINLDYGRARGLEVKLEKKFSAHWQASFNYDFSYAYGKASGANDEFERRSLNVPVNYDEHPLNWDETHRITANAALMYQKDDHPYLFGFRLPDYWLMSVNWQFGSGRPYTPSEYTTGIDANLILQNSERMPWTEETTLRFEKYFDIGSVKTIWGITINNLWDKKNWNSVYTETGSPIYAIHPLNPDYNPFLNRYEYDANPRNYGSGRQILLKVGIEY